MFKGDNINIRNLSWEIRTGSRGPMRARRAYVVAAEYADDLAATVELNEEPLLEILHVCSRGSESHRLSSDRPLASLGG